MSDREWWTEQWLDLINSYRFKKRLERGWKYAREGNVLNIDFQDQKVLSQVKGTEPEPYQVSLWLDLLTDEDWEYVIESMAQRAIFSAKLLAGEMPHNIEEVFATAGKRLFPFSLSEVHSRCSCPDQANPCKHISAVYYLLGDRFSEDPFVLFQLRGRTKEQILAKLRQLRGNGEDESETSNSAESSQTTHYPLGIANYQSPEIAQYWEYSQPLESSLVVITPPPSSETVLDILGLIPLAGEAGKSAGKSPSVAELVMEYLGNIYRDVSQQAVLEALKRGEGD